MTPEALLTELPQEATFGSYAELESQLTDVMRENRDQVPVHVTAADVLHYAAEHGLVSREGNQFVIQVK